MAGSWAMLPVDLGFDSKAMRVRLCQWQADGHISAPLSSPFVTGDTFDMNSPAGSL
jgi:hypothetical protein